MVNERDIVLGPAQIEFKSPNAGFRGRAKGSESVFLRAASAVTAMRNHLSALQRLRARRGIRKMREDPIRGFHRELFAELDEPI